MMNRASLHGRIVSIRKSGIRNVFISDNIRITYRKEIATKYVHSLAVCWVNFKVIIKKLLFGEM